MNRLSVILGALVLAAAFVPHVAQAQLTYCMTDGFFYAWNVTLTPASDILTGTVDLGAGSIQEAVGSRGTTGSERRNVILQAVYYDGTAGVNWFEYNGLVTPSGGGTYSYAGNWINSPGASGTFTGTFVPGACPAPRGDREIDPNGPAAH
jgi:hypothetical protein